MSFFTAHVFFEGIACWALVVLVGVNGARVQGADTLAAAFRRSGSTDAVRDGLERKSFWRVGYSASRGAAVVTKERMLPLVEEVPWSVGVHVSRDALPTSVGARPWVSVAIFFLSFHSFGVGPGVGLRALRVLLVPVLLFASVVAGSF